MKSPLMILGNGAEGVDGVVADAIIGLAQATINAVAVLVNNDSATDSVLEAEQHLCSGVRGSVI